MSDRDELAQLTFATLQEDETERSQWVDANSMSDVVIDGRFDLLALADAILAAGYRKPRTITTVEELEALPELSAVIDSDGDVSQKRGGFWCGYETAPLASKRLALYAPITVLYTPDAAL